MKKRNGDGDDSDGDDSDREVGNRICGPACVNGGWEIDCDVPLQYADGRPVMERGTTNQVVVHVSGKGDGSSGFPLEITLNHSNVVGPGKDGLGNPPRYAHPHPRNRKWQINHPERLMDAKGRPVIADPGGAVVLRVQAYGYEPDYVNAPKPEPNHCSGTGPKICLQMINPNPHGT